VETWAIGGNKSSTLKDVFLPPKEAPGREKGGGGLRTAKRETSTIVRNGEKSTEAAQKKKGVIIQGRTHQGLVGTRKGREKRTLSGLQY